METSNKRLLVIGLVLLGCIVFGVFSLRAQSQTVPPSYTPEYLGQYQMIRQSDNTMWLYDTMNGRCWLYISGGGWTEMEPEGVQGAAKKAAYSGPPVADPSQKYGATVTNH